MLPDIVESVPRSHQIVASLMADPAPPAVGKASRALIHLIRMESQANRAERSYTLAFPLWDGLHSIAVGQLDLQTVSPGRALLAGLSAVAMNCVRHTEIQIGDPVIVFGADPWSLLLVQWALLQGASPVVFAGRGSRSLCDLASSLGIDGCLLDPSPGDLSRAVKLTHRGGGFAAAFDALATEQSVSEALPLLRDGGRYVLAAIEAQPQVSLNAYPDLHRRDLEMLSAMPPANEADAARMFRFSLELTDKGRLHLESLIDPASGWRVVASGNARDSS